MYGTFIEFSYPWLLLLLIPALAVSLIPHFVSAKKYRRNRNKITSLVLHAVAMTLAVFALSGIKFVSRVPNDTNEIIILVDMSDSGTFEKDKRDDFVETLVKQVSFDGFKIGVVTFGYDTVYAVDLNGKSKDVFGDYKAAPLPDVAATDIAGALDYTKDLFTSPETAKIVLVTDGKETDGKASSVIRAISARGTRVDVAHIPSGEGVVDVRITSIGLPDTHINVNEVYPVTITLDSTEEFSAELTFYDNGEAKDDEKVVVDIVKGENVVRINHAFTVQGLHEMYCTLTVSGDDDIMQNNEYYAYHYLKLYNKVLIYETAEGDSTALAEVLSSDGKFEVDVVNILSEDAPSTVDDLRRYDEVIMNNVAYSDIALHEGFESALNEYVRDYGGGLFTVGGDDEAGGPRAYDRTDMLYSTYYKQMLPVEVIRYTPPVAVMILIDRSGSMGQDVEGSNFWYAKAGAASCVNALTERDYIGVITFEDTFHYELPLTSRTQESKILSTINKITTTAGGGTVFPGAIQRAGMALRELKTVEKRHIIIVTDGGVPDYERPEYERLIKEFYDTNGITFSTVLIGEPLTSEAGRSMRYASEDLGHGRIYSVAEGDNRSLIRLMREDLNVPEIKETQAEEFFPVVADPLSKVADGIETENKEGVKNSMTVSLGGFYGVKARSAATTVLTGPYGVPLYSYWKYGAGFVGSFMSDLNGRVDGWSNEFLSSDMGVRFVQNALYSVMPVESVRTEDFDMRLTEENYTNRISVFTPLSEGETYGGTIEYLDGGDVASLTQVVPADADRTGLSAYVTAPFSAENGYARAGFVARKGGVYKITVIRYDAGGNTVGTVQIYKQFAYSKEYDLDYETDYFESLKSLALAGQGAFISDLEDPKEVFATFTLTLDKVFDPRVLLMILVITLFVADVAVRKFKFKWPHELILSAIAKRKEKGKIKR